MDANALLSHILYQTRQNVEFLIAQKQISSEVGQDILRKIPSTPASVEFPSASPGVTVSELARRTSTLSVSPSGTATATTTVETTTQAVSGPTSGYPPPISAPSYPPPPAHGPPVLFRAKALWDYSQVNLRFTVLVTRGH